MEMNPTHFSMKLATTDIQPLTHRTRSRPNFRTSEWTGVEPANLIPALLSVSRACRCYKDSHQANDALHLI